jgi:nitroimidazol reductase NimA-like FMN-containing flavoprotein (pyridoxamine 5'-phosphate oxidase superfamily)
MPDGRIAVSYAMSRAEREQFLARPHIGVLSVVEGGAPLTVPIWYGYQPGGQVTLITSEESRKARAVREVGWLSLCTQDDAWPYKYVTASGPAAVHGPASHAVQRIMAVRYLGETGADDFMEWVTASGEVDEQIIIEMTPQTWLTLDYSKPA